MIESRRFYSKPVYPILARSMMEELPKYLDTRYLAEQIGPLSGVISSDRLQRIRPPYSAVRPVMVRLDILQDDSRIRLGGKISTQLTATCQRCLNDMDIAIDKKIDVLLCESTDIQTSSRIENDDVLIIDQGKIDIEQLVEDELMLSCPMIPLHEDMLCSRSEIKTSKKDIDIAKPFAELADLIRRGETKTSDR